MQVNPTMFLGALGLTKKSAAQAALAMVARRVAVVQFNEADRFLPPSDEIHKFLSSSAYRKDMKKIGKSLHGNYLHKENLVTRLLNVFSEHSVTAETMLDNLEEDDGELVVNDEVVNSAIGAAVGILRTYAGPALGVELEGEFAPLDAPTAKELGDDSLILGDALKAIIDGTSDEDLFPDLHMHLSRK